MTASTRRSARLGIALTPERVVAVEARTRWGRVQAGRTESRVIDPPAPDGGWPSLTSALADIRATLGGPTGGRTRLAVTLLPPLAQAKLIATPALGRRDLRSYVNRNIRRYFIVGSEPVLSDAHRRPFRRAAATLALCAPERTVNGVLRAAAAAGGLEVETLTAEPADLDQPHDAAGAALGAAALAEDGPQLWPAERRGARTSHQRRRAAGLLAATTALLGFAAGTHLWGLNRELTQVAARRAALAPRVAAALVQRRGLDDARTLAATLARLEAEAPSWTLLLADVTAALPQSAFLVSLTADGSRIRLAGMAPSASTVVPALEAAPLLKDVSLTSAARSGAAGARERFELELHPAGAAESSPEPNR